MSKPSDRKRQKQKDRQTADAKRRYQTEQKRLYAQTFPGFDFKENGAPPEFVAHVKQALKTIDFRDPRIFSTWETRLYKLAKQCGNGVIRHVLQQMKSNPAAQADFLSKLGEAVFSKIPQKELRKWIPYHTVKIFPRGEDVLVSFRSLLTAKGPGGTTYYSHHKPPLQIDGQTRIVGFSQHAIERICERIVPEWYTYSGLNSAFMFFDWCVHFEQSDLPNGQLGFTFFAPCQKGFFGWRYVEEVLGTNVEDDEHYYYRVGYCPAVIEGNFIKAKTLLFPGQEGTPEYPLVWASDVPMDVKKQAGDMDAAWILATEDFRLVKFFHQRGIPQVIHDKCEFFRPSI